MNAPRQSEMVREAFRYQAALTSYAFGLLRDWSLAKDVIQDAFVVLIQKYGENEETGGVFHLMKQIVRFKVLETIRKRSREFAVDDEELTRLVGETLDEAVSKEEAAHYSARLVALHECMSGANDSLKRLLIGFYWRHESYEDLAKATGRGVPSLRVMMMRARGKLRDCMELRLKSVEVTP